MSGLTDFLLARIAEDEASAREAAEIDQEVFGSKDGCVIDYLWARMVTYPSGGRGHTFAPGAPTPAQVLAECEAKRRIVEHCTEQAAKCPEDDWPADGDMSWAPLADNARHLLRLMTLPYADHPDYREEWRP